MLPSTETKHPCQHCRNYQFIISQLKLLKKQIIYKNQRIVDLELFIAKISNMALNDQTQSSTNQYFNNVGNGIGNGSSYGNSSQGCSQNGNICRSRNMDRNKIKNNSCKILHQRNNKFQDTNYNPMDLTFKNSQDYNQDSFQQSHNTKRSHISNSNSNILKTKNIHNQSISDSNYYATQSQPYDQGVLHQIGSVKSLNALLSKRHNQSTNMY